MSDESLPLTGIRVVDMSTSYAGPTATMYLADLGAEVIKVERPGGDDARGWGPPFLGQDSAWFHSANRNKKSVVLDLKHADARVVLERLIESAHVFVENLNPAKLTRIGLEPAAVLDRHPGLVYCALSGFGLTGPDTGLPGYDLIAQARSGLMSVTGALDGMPQRVSTALSDIVSGLVVALAATAALRRAERTGQGEIVDVSLLDTDLALMAPRIASYLAGEPEPAPSGGTDSVLAIYQPFATADEPIVLAVGSDVIWQRMCAVLDLPGEARDAATNARRRVVRPLLLEAIAARLATAPAKDWLERFAGAQVPAATIARLSAVVTDPQVIARGGIRALDSGVQVVASPWRYQQGRARLQTAPVLGADTECVLAGLGIANDELDRLRRTGAVGGAPE
ncbi:CaiB/BaiF CoA transferase family protein [Kribbella kalugense]|uniref:Crotonobetainyl-CoA:carnitine CoA-transferase CaiB-like acyl-CoA transferase n=1 Tax=Kribbella kalugense TaxID=2512221 RepID=A0A4R8A132_9ACTN|nr:CoA transferase [Kribbella kalugense]TDW24203.1 crotonobetainyl-CoA:carnitine CoA-transferase CaiB-like acyl-CoA transferase [Kribbella kalugense]